MQIRKAAARGQTQIAWLDSKHSFSFGDYYDPAHMGFGTLRVINDDLIQPGAGFPTHSHRDMEIITYVLSGELAHKDSMGTGSTIRPGEVQRMSAGSGVTHSEYNPSNTDTLHLLQIWITPRQLGLKPSYDQKTFARADKLGKLKLVVSGDGRDRSIKISQNADMYAGIFDDPKQTCKFVVRDGRQVWVHVARGAIEVNGQKLAAGDAASFDQAADVEFKYGADAEVLVFDLG